MFISIQHVLEKLREVVSSRGSPCSLKTFGVQLSDDLYLDGPRAVLKTEAGYKCLEVETLSEALRTLAHPATIEERPFRTLAPPYVELYEDERKYVVLGLYEGRVYMAEWSGIRLCCSWVTDIDTTAYRNAVDILKAFVEDV